MNELKKMGNLLAHDLLFTMEDMVAGDPDSMDDACAKMQDLIFNLKELHTMLLYMAEDARRGRD